MRVIWKVYYFRIECGIFKYDNLFGGICDMNCVEDEIYLDLFMIIKLMLLYW